MLCLCQTFELFGLNSNSRSGFSGIEKAHTFASTKNQLILITMAYQISSECITCGTCKGECPVEAISEGAEQYSINPDVCMDCGTCAGVCPVEAIKPA